MLNKKCKYLLIRLNIYFVEINYFTFYVEVCYLFLQVKFKMSNRSTSRRTTGNGGNGPNKTCQFKLVLLGESAVGKSSLVLRFVKGQFHEYQESTIGAAFLTQTICLDDTTVKFEIWDTAGQERFCLLLLS